MADVVDLLSSALRDVENTRYSELASSSIIIYDYLVTLDQEIRHMWNAKWTIGKILFFLNRYYTLFVVIFNNYALFSSKLTDNIVNDTNSGLHWFQWQGWTGLIAAFLAETILQLRIYALYYGNKKVLVLMVSFFLLAMVASAVIMGNALHDIEARATLIPGTKFCVPAAPLAHFYAFWIPILSFETLLCTLVCVRGYRSYKNHEIRLKRRLYKASRLILANSQQQESKNSSDKLSVLEILLRDSVGYFIVIFATYLTTTMIWIFGPITVIEIPIGFTVALASVITNRLLLNLRGIKTRNANDQNASSSHVRARSASVSRIRSIGVTTIEDEQGRELPAYELDTLRSLKASA